MAEDVRSSEGSTVNEGRMGVPEPIEPGSEEPGDGLVPPAGENREPGRLAVSTAFFALATGLSRIAGLVREIVAASYFGVTGPMSAFTIAFQVPNLVRSLFADSALQAAFVPVFTEQLEKRGRSEAFRVASALVFVIAVVLGSLTALFVLLAPVIMPLFAPGFDQNLTDLTIRLAQILFPIVLLLGFSGLVVGVLNSFDQFAVPALAPLAWNVVIILTLVLLTASTPTRSACSRARSCSYSCRCRGCAVPASGWCAHSTGATSASRG
jgi:putative peptidoglycan lipid II flippase